MERALAKGFESPRGVSVMQSVRRCGQDLQVVESISGGEGGEGGEASGDFAESDDILEQLGADVGASVDAMRA